MKQFNAKVKVNHQVQFIEDGTLLNQELCISLKRSTLARVAEAFRKRIGGGDEITMGRNYLNESELKAFSMLFGWHDNRIKSRFTCLTISEC